MSKPSVRKTNKKANQKQKKLKNVKHTKEKLLTKQLFGCFWKPFVWSCYISAVATNQPSQRPASSRACAGAAARPHECSAGSRGLALVSLVATCWLSQCVGWDKLQHRINMNDHIDGKKWLVFVGLVVEKCCTPWILPWILASYLEFLGLLLRKFGGLSLALEYIGMTCW